MEMKFSHSNLSNRMKRLLLLFLLRVGLTAIFAWICLNVYVNDIFVVYLFNGYREKVHDLLKIIKYSTSHFTILTS